MNFNRQFISRPKLLNINMSCQLVFKDSPTKVSIVSSLLAFIELILFSIWNLLLKLSFLIFLFPTWFCQFDFSVFFFSGREEEKNIRKQADHDRWYTLLIWCFIIARSIVHSDALQCDAAWMVITFRLGKKNWRRTQEGPLYYDIDLRRAGGRIRLLMIGWL